MVRLPKVFPIQNDEKIRNNKTFSYNKTNSLIRNDKKVKEQINKIFKSDKQVYSIDCMIVFKDEKKKYTLIGATTNHLITRDKRLIPIDDVYDIII